MSTTLNEWLQKTIAELEEERDATPVAVNEDAAKALEAMKIALASLEAEPVAYMYKDNLHADVRFSLHTRFGNWSQEDINEYEITEIPLYSAPPAQVVNGEYSDAYQGAREDLAIWKRRALEAECHVRRLGQINDYLVKDAQGESRMGEPVIREQAPVSVPADYFASLVAAARVRADKAMRKFPQPNYVLNKVAEESGEVIKAVIHFTEGREEWQNVEGEIIDNLAMLIRLVMEGDQVIGFTPPDVYRAAMLQGAEPVKTANKLRDAVEVIRNSGIAIDGEMILAERDALNSPVTPDGWVMVPIEPTAEMISSGIAAHFERSQTQIHDRPAPGPMECAYVAMLAAAPQKEVK